MNIKREPVVAGDIVKVLAIVSAFWSPMGDAVIAAGGEAALGAAVASIWAFITFFLQREKVSPVAPEPKA